MNRIAIIDGNSLINRAYYAMRNPMITKEGIFTQGIFGFINMLDKIISGVNDALYSYILIIILVCLLERHLILLL